MGRRIHLDDEAQHVRNPHDAVPTDEPIASTAAVLDVAGRAQQPGRGGDPAVGRAIDSLNASAGNVAVAQLFAGRTASQHRDGRPQVRAGQTTVADRPVVQLEPEDEPGTEEAEPTGPAMGDTGATELGAGVPAAGSSWTKVGPPTNTTYSVSGTLREVANAVGARPEAGSVTATVSAKTDTPPPEEGTDKVLAARVTVAQVMELPTWTDKSKATKNQQAEWDRFHAAITTHENGHVSTDKTSFAGAHTKMVGKPQADADAALDTVEAQATTDNKTYDTTTNSGLNQGTGINPNIDEVTKVP